MRYIELFGLPGVGKTTISIPVINRLREDGFKVGGLKDVYFRNCNSGKKKVLLEMALSVKYYPLYYSLLHYGLSVPRTKDKTNYLFKYLFYVHQLIKAKEKGNFDIILCEEGVIQHMTSLCYVQYLPDSKLLKKFLLKINKVIDIIAIDCNISIEESLSRIDNRGNTSRRFSSKTSSELLKLALNVKACNLEIVARNMPTIHKLPMENSVERNINELYFLILELMN